MTKTWKIGEYSKTGIITINVSKKTITVIEKEWDYSKGSSKGSNQSQARIVNENEVENKPGAYHILYNILSDNTTHYYADTILKWIETKTKLEK